MGKNVSAMQATSDEGQVIVSPHPANQTLKLRLWNKTISGKLSLELMYQNGRIAKQWIRNYDADGQQLALPVAEIPGGVYIVVIKESKGRQVRQQVVVMH